MSTLAERVRRADPLLMAGSSFAVVGGILLAGAYLLHSGIVVSLGIETVFDGMMYLAGGFAGGWLSRPGRPHALYCWARQGLELAVLGAGIVYLIGALLQPQSSDGLTQVGLGWGAALVAIAMTRYWHPKLEDHGGHGGFDWHLKADMVIASSAAAGASLAWALVWPEWNFWLAVGGAVVAIGMSIKPFVELLRGMWHRATNHVTAQPHHDHH